MELEKREVENNTVTSKDYKFEFTGEELLKRKMEDMPMLLAPFFPKSGLALFYGSSDTGKSAFLNQLALSIVLGEDTFLGFKLFTEHKRVIYYSIEDDDDRISVVLNKQSNGEIRDEELRNLEYVFHSDNLLKNLEKKLSEKPVDCVIIDPLGDIFDGSFNQCNEVRRFLEPFRILGMKYKCLIIFLHHSGKNKENESPSKGNSLGSQGIEGKVRVSVEFRKDFLNPNIRHFCVVKGNYIENEFKNRSIELEFSDNLTFSNTGRMIDFNLLGKPEFDFKEQIINNRVVELSKEGLTVREISKKMTNEGLKIGKSKVGEILSVHNNPLEEEDSGQIAA